MVLLQMKVPSDERSSQKLRSKHCSQLNMRPTSRRAIFSDMKDTVVKALPIIRKSAPYIMRPMMEPALKIALDSLNDYQRKAGSGVEGLFQVPNTERCRLQSTRPPSTAKPRLSSLSYTLL